MKQEMNTQARKQNNVIVIIFAVLLVVVLAVVIVLAVKKNRADIPAASIDETIAEESTEIEKWQEGTVSYNGKRYRYNTALKTYLFMGIDKAGTVEEAEDGISGGQSDAMFLLVEDAKTQKLSIIAINRNTMAMVDVYDEAGNYVGQRKLQICLQHGYGDGMRTSCLRTVDAVSRLFYQLPISGYLSLQMEAVPVLNDAVGGVTVEVMDDIENEALGVSLKKGETITLNGNEAYVYLRSRDLDEFASASRRLERQQQYLIGFLSQAKGTALTGERTVMQIYDAISDYMVTNIDFVDLVTEAKDYTFDDSCMYSVPGELLMGVQFEEYYVDDDALYEMIIDIFYEPVEE